jgi:hypothetical protein
MSEWTEERLLALIAGQVQESISLEYKSAASLQATEEKKREVVKDVSAMANSAGGIVIYGIQEYQDKDKRHLPERIDAVDVSIYSREWLEQVINNIQPRVDGIRIMPVQLAADPGGAVYVVDIPQSHTAHQARDKRYYKRFNFCAQAMEDYEIRDVLNRAKHPKIDLQFTLVKTVQETYQVGHSHERRFRDAVSLRTVARNVGSVYAMYVNVFLTIPIAALPEHLRYGETVHVDGVECADINHTNTARDVVDFTGGPYSTAKYGPRRYEPILPRLSDHWTDLLRDDVLSSGEEVKIRWSVHADSAPAKNGEILLGQITIDDRT